MHLKFILENQINEDHNLKFKHIHFNYMLSIDILIYDFFLQMYILIKNIYFRRFHIMNNH